MSALTDRCYDCGAEYVPLSVDDGRCPDCDSPATPIVGTPRVFDVRPPASLDLEGLPAEGAIEVLVRDDTDRLLVYAFAIPQNGRPYAVAISFGDVTVRRGDEHWSAIDGPACVVEAVADAVGSPPGPPPSTGAADRERQADADGSGTAAGESAPDARESGTDSKAQEPDA